MKTVLFLALVLLAGCATSPAAPNSNRVGDIPEPVLPVFSGGARLIDHSEIRLLDSRLIRSINRRKAAGMSLSLSQGGRLALLVSGSIIGVYVLSEWIEDNVPASPGL